MPMLRPVDHVSLAKEKLAQLPPSQPCDSCGKVVAVRDGAINTAMVANVLIDHPDMYVNIQHQIGSPGHPGIQAFMCPAGEHWACSPACFRDVTIACLDEHIMPLLHEIHKGLHPEWYAAKDKLDAEGNNSPQVVSPASGYSEPGTIDNTTMSTN